MTDLMSPTWATVRALNEQIASLQEQLAQARAAVKAPSDEAARLCDVLQLSPQEGRLLAALYASRSVCAARRWLIAAADFQTCNEQDPDIKMLDVYVCKLRRKLGRTFIKTHRGMGFSLSAEGREALRVIIQPQHGRAA